MRIFFFFSAASFGSEEIGGTFGSAFLFSIVGFSRQIVSESNVLEVSLKGGCSLLVNVLATVFLT